VWAGSPAVDAFSVLVDDDGVAGRPHPLDLGWPEPLVFGQGTYWLKNVVPVVVVVVVVVDVRHSIWKEGSTEGERRRTRALS
jgi:hypothetical protein